MSDLVDEITYRLAQPVFRDFRPWVTPEGASPQKEFLRAFKTHKIVVFRAGNRSGKTTIAGVNVALFALGWHPHAQHVPPVKIWCVALDWEKVSAYVWPAIEPWIPKDQIDAPACKWQRVAEPATPILITLKNGSTIEFKSADARVDKFAGAKIHFCWIDEEVSRELAQEIRARLIDYHGVLALTLTPVQRRLWVKELEDEDNGRATKVVRASMLEAARAGVIPIDAALSFLRSLPDRDRRVRELGDFAAFEGAVYPEYRREVHVLKPRDGGLWTWSGGTFKDRIYSWPLNPEWPRFAAHDFGFGVPGATVLVAHDPDRDALIVTNVWHAANVRIDDWIRVEKQLPPLRYPLICDHDAGDREMFHANGIATVPAPKHPTDLETGVREGITFVGRRLTLTSEDRPRIYLVVHDDNTNWPTNPITGRCDAQALDREFQNYRYEERRRDEARDQADRPFKKDDHALDAFRYLVRYVDGRSKTSLFDDLAKLVGPKAANPIGGIVPPKPRGSM